MQLYKDKNKGYWKINSYTKKQKTKMKSAFSSYAPDERAVAISSEI